MRIEYRILWMGNTVEMTGGWHIASSAWSNFYKLNLCRFPEWHCIKTWLKLQVKSGIATFSMKVEEDMDVIQQAIEKLDKYLP